MMVLCNRSYAGGIPTCAGPCGTGVADRVDESRSGGSQRVPCAGRPCGTTPEAVPERVAQGLGGNPRSQTCHPVDCAAVPGSGGHRRTLAAGDRARIRPTVRRAGAIGRPVRWDVRSPARRAPGHGRQRPPRPRARRRGPDGRQRAVAEGGEPPDHAGRRPPGDGRRRRRRRPRARGRSAGDRPRRAELHRRHAGRPGRADARAPSCSRSSATTPPPG